MSEALADRLGLGISYRQLDHWTRLGYLHPVLRRGPGIGRPREWPEYELATAAAMGRLVRLGLSLELAHRVARRGHGAEAEVRFALRA